MPDITPFHATPEFDPYFLDALSPVAETEIARHQRERKDWSYHDILPRDVIAELSAAPPVEADEQVQLIYLGNLAVEKGHAEYDKVTASVFEQSPAFRMWKNIWVSEEEPHGAAMQEWAKIRGLLDMDAVHKNIRGFLQNGLSLEFDDAAKGLAYPALQEPATKVTHREVKDRLPEEEKEGRRVLAKIIADEERHERFYANMVRHALHSGEVAIASHQMRGIARAVFGFGMPGMDDDIPDREAMTQAYNKTRAFTVGKVVREVLLPAIDGEGNHGWSIAEVDALDDSARQAQEELVTFAQDIKHYQEKDRRLLLIMGKARKRLEEADA